MDSHHQASPPEVNAFYRGVVFATLFTAMAFALLIGGCTAVKASAVNPPESSRTEVKVKCADLWMHDHAASDVNRCRAKGWHISWRYNLSPDGRRIWTGLKPCRQEDSAHCYWNAHSAGNGHGHSFVNLGGRSGKRVIYVHQINGHRA